MNNKKIMAGALILINVILWILFIVPGIFHLFNQKAPLKETVSIVNSPPAENEEITDLDFGKTRDPFAFSAINNKKTPVKEKSRRIANPVTAVVHTEIKEEKYISRFILKSIVFMNNEYTAILQEIPSYGSMDENTINSFRMQGTPESEMGQTYIVKNGSVVNGEEVFKIKSDSIILKKDGKYYELSITNGKSVEY